MFLGVGDVITAVRHASCLTNLQTAPYITLILIIRDSGLRGRITGRSITQHGFRSHILGKEIMNILQSLPKAALKDAGAKRLPKQVSLVARKKNLRCLVLGPRESKYPVKVQTSVGLRKQKESVLRLDA